MIKTTIKVCHGNACTKNFSSYTFERARQELKIEDPNGGISADGGTKLEKCGCQGQCSKGPVVLWEGDEQKTILHRVTSMEMGNMIKNN